MGNSSATNFAAQHLFTIKAYAYAWSFGLGKACLLIDCFLLLRGESWSIWGTLLCLYVSISNNSSFIFFSLEYDEHVSFMSFSCWPYFHVLVETIFWFYLGIHAVKGWMAIYLHVLESLVLLFSGLLLKAWRILWTTKSCTFFKSSYALIHVYLINGHILFAFPCYSRIVDLSDEETGILPPFR